MGEIIKIDKDNIIVHIFVDYLLRNFKETTAAIVNIMNGSVVAHLRHLTNGRCACSSVAVPIEPRHHHNNNRFSVMRDPGRL